MSYLVEDKMIKLKDHSSFKPKEMDFSYSVKKAVYRFSIIDFSKISNFIPLSVEELNIGKVLKYKRVSEASRIVTFLGANLDLDTGYFMLDYFKNDTYYPIFDFWAYLNQRGYDIDSARMSYLIEEYKLKNMSIEKFIQELQESKTVNKGTFIKFHIRKMSKEVGRVEALEEIRQFISDILLTLSWWEEALRPTGKIDDVERRLVIPYLESISEEEKEEAKELEYAINKMSGLSNLYRKILLNADTTLKTLSGNYSPRQNERNKAKIDDAIYSLSSSMHTRFYYASNSDEYANLRSSFRNATTPLFSSVLQSHQKYFSYLYNTIDLFEVIDKEVAIRFVAEEYDDLHSNVANALIKGLKLKELAGDELVQNFKRGLASRDVRKPMVEEDGKVKALPGEYKLCKSIKAEQFSQLTEKIADRVNNIK